MLEDLELFHTTLEEIEHGFFQVAARSSELEAYGLRRVSKWLDLSSLLPALDRFPIELSTAQRITNIVDKASFVALSKLLDETQLEDLIARFSVKLRISEQERPMINPIYAFISTFKVAFLRRESSDLFANNDVSLEAVLSAISRIKSLIKIVGSDMETRFNNDDEIFKPSNISSTKISVEIDAAISILQSDSSLGMQERDRLIDYLQEAKGELSKKEPSWRKVVGALVIASTLLGGAAVAPQAAENINTAINYILGTSIVSNESEQLKLPEYKEGHTPKLPTTYSI